MLKNIFVDCGIHVRRYEEVHGGDINKAYCLYTQDDKYFLKVNEEKRYPGMFDKEAKGLDLLRNNCTLIIPGVIKTGSCNQQQYLLLEWLEKGSIQKDTWKNFGNRLAIMHKKPQAYFGLGIDNYIGSLKQNNTRHNEWNSFYAECRIIPLVQILFNSGSFTHSDVLHATSFCNKLSELFPADSPALLHGDLWGGNYLITSGGNAAIYDPAVYYGHREMDIGMSKLFGGFAPQFYDAYNSTYPLGKGWEKRLPVSELYPLLVHAVLFGGHYVQAARDIMIIFGK